MIATNPTTNGHAPSTAQLAAKAVPVMNPNRRTAVLV